MKGGEGGEHLAPVDGFEVSERVCSWLESFGVGLGGLEQPVELGAAGTGEQADDGPQCAEPRYLLRAVEAGQPWPELFGGRDHRAPPCGVGAREATVSEPANRSASARS